MSYSINSGVVTQYHPVYGSISSRIINVIVTPYHIKYELQSCNVLYVDHNNVMVNVIPLQDYDDNNGRTYREA